MRALDPEFSHERRTEESAEERQTENSILLVSSVLDTKHAEMPWLYQVTICIYLWLFVYISVLYARNYVGEHRELDDQ